MNSKIKTLLAGSALIAACAVMRAQAPATPAAADGPMMAPAPSADYVWMSGHWNSEAGQWKWVAGSWTLPPNRNAAWVAGHWVQGSAGWVWVNGAWNVGEAPQSQSSPPMPPGQASAGQPAAQGVPMPSTAAPYVAGQYPQGAQVPVMDQPPVTTEYAPIDYSYGYPDYYWPDTLAWGLYPGALFFGLGWGPGYWGHGGYYGHAGYYGHGGYGGVHGGAAVHFSGGGHFR